MTACTDIRVRRDLQFSEISWDRVISVLTSEYSLNQNTALRLVSDFQRRFMRPFNLYWFLSKRLSKADNAVAAALCTTQGADILALQLQRSLWMANSPFRWQQEIEFKPELRRSEMLNQLGTQSTKMQLQLFNFALNLNSFSKLFALQMVSFILAIIFYVFLFGAFLYSLSVFMLFMFLTPEVTSTATTNGSIGVALLSFLVCFAAAFGKVIRDIFRFIVRRLTGRIGYGKAVRREGYPKRA